MEQHIFDFGEAGAPSASAQRKSARAGTFADNMKLPVHRWFRYSAGFSAKWAEKVIRDSAIAADQFVFDPFCGSGTTLLAAQNVGVNSAGAENHGFVTRIAEAKLLWQNDESEFLTAAISLVGDAKAFVRGSSTTSSDLLTRCYSPEALCRLEALRRAWEHVECAPKTKKLLWLALTAILRECSGVGTAQWQYILPNKSKSRVTEPFAAFVARAKLFAADMAALRTPGKVASAQVRNSDARKLTEFSELKGRVDLVVTSPPYPNNFDYADATRLEMTFWGEVESWSDLQKAVRHRLVRSCSQHSSAEQLKLSDLLSDESVAPIKDELAEVCTSLEAIRETKGGKKSYHTMVAAYFADLSKTWRALSELCADGAKVCFVIGDSAPYGIYVPVEKWLGYLAIAQGFKVLSFEKIRDRNMKWKNRKHRVPLKEGYLWVEK